MTTSINPEPAGPGTGKSAGTLRFVSVRANLMPDEVIIARRTEVVRKRVLLALALLVALLIAGFGASWLQTESARGDLSDLQHQGSALVDQQSQYAPVVQTQSKTQAITSQLQTLMAGDLSWKTMLSTLRSKAPAGVTFTSITATVTAPGGAAGSTGVGAAVPLDKLGQTAIGTLAISGSAIQKTDVATYVDNLRHANGLASPLITSVAANNSGGAHSSGPAGYSYTISVIVTSKAFGGRYAQPAPSTSGGTTTTGATTGSTNQTGTAAGPPAQTGGN